MRASSRREPAAARALLMQPTHPTLVALALLLSALMTAAVLAAVPAHATTTTASP
jgi:hypothetical protein